MTPYRLHLRPSIFLALLIFASPVDATTGGPDVYGYTFKDSFEMSGPVFDWVELSETGIGLGLGDNAFSPSLQLGFQFQFYGTFYSEVIVGSNGWIHLEDGAALNLGPANQCPLPDSTDNNNLIAVFWDDLDPSAPGSGEVYMRAFGPGECPYDGGYAGSCFVVEWEGVYLAGTTDPVTAEAILFDDHSILIQILFPTSQAGLTSTVGIENRTGQVGLTYACDSPGSLSSNLAILFAAPVSPVGNNTKVGLDPNSCAVTKAIEAPVGGNVSYCFEIGNNGTQTFDRLSLETSELGTILSDFPYALAPAATAFITAEMKVHADVINYATWTLEEMATGIQAQGVDSATVTVSPPLVLTKSVGTDPRVCANTNEATVEAGINVYYCYEIMNISEATFTTHTLVDSEIGTILKDFPYLLLSGASAFVTAEVNLSSSVINTATWSAMEIASGLIYSDTDQAIVHVPEEPTSTPTTTLTPTSTPTSILLADLEILKSASPENPLVGGTLLYTLRVTNHGPNPVMDVEIRDFLPATVALVSADSRCVAGSDELVCAIGPMGAGEVDSVTLAVQLLAECNLCNFAQVTGNLSDPIPANNSVILCSNGTAQNPSATPTSTPDNTLTPTPEPSFHPADIDEDRRIDSNDLLELMRAWKSI